MTTIKKKRSFTVIAILKNEVSSSTYLKSFYCKSGSIWFFYGGNNFVMFLS